MSTLTKLALCSAIALVGVLPAHAANYTIVLGKMRFGAVPAELHTGDTITWQNNDIFRHTATARDQSFDVDLPPKAEVKMVVGQARRVDFFCKFHPGMTGTLVISP